MVSLKRSGAVTRRFHIIYFITGIVSTKIDRNPVTANDQARAEYVLEQIQKLYAIERNADQEQLEAEKPPPINKIGKLLPHARDKGNCQ